MMIFWVVVIGIVLVLAEGYIWSVRRCRLCNGTGVHRSPFTRSTRPCRCGGGQVLTWRARMLGRRIQD